MDSSNPSVDDIMYTCCSAFIAFMKSRLISHALLGHVLATCLCNDAGKGLFVTVLENERRASAIIVADADPHSVEFTVDTGRERNTSITHLLHTDNTRFILLFLF